MKVITATYGCGDKTVDVSQHISSMLGTEKELNFSVSNNMFGGDPIHGLPKELVIVYTADQETCNRTLVVQEGNRCVYPGPYHPTYPPSKPTVPGKVTCMCPTRGRFTLLQKSISYFLLQDYENKELLILNNHAVPLNLSPELEALGNIKVLNMGEVNDMVKLHNDALEYVDGEYICIWEDDDIYLPWHLSNIDRYPLEGEWEAIKPSVSVMVTTIDGRLDTTLGDNYFEASYIVKSETIRLYGFGEHDNPEIADPRFWHWRWLDKIGRSTHRPNFIDCGYVYTWDRQFLDGEGCIHSSGNTTTNLQQHSHDTGNQEPLRAVDITHIFDVLENTRKGLNNGKLKISSEKVEAYLNKLYSYAKPGLYNPTKERVETCSPSTSQPWIDFELPKVNNDHRYDDLYVFYHLWCEGGWKSIIWDALSKFPKSLIDKTHLYVCASNKEFTPECVPPPIRDNLTIIYSKEGDEGVSGEWSTLRLVKEFCESHPKNVPVMYLHSKGCTHKDAEREKYIKDWANLMLYFLVEKYEDAFNVMEYADAVGCNLTNFNYQHFSGNFWMAWSKHIKKLQYPNKFNLGDRFKAEFWIGTHPTASLMSLHTSMGGCCHNWHYYNYYPRSKYEY
jgi:hypothetical protein